MLALGFDTSNYTTSCAWCGMTDGENFSRLLDVRQGELGLRQSDALFCHIKRLPELTDRLFVRFDHASVKCVGVSTRPRAVEGSYMPCFLAGVMQAKAISAALSVPCHTFSHQQGHIAAVLWNANRLDLMHRPYLAWHLSGGTTELLLVTPNGKSLDASIIGGTSDISAGQLIDRTGQLLDFAFPAGKQIDIASSKSDSDDFFKVKVNGSQFSLSGVQNQVKDYYTKTHDASATARFALRSVSYGIRRATENAMKVYPGYPVVFSGGVSSNSLLRSEMSDFDAVFADPCYSADNAMGIAVLAYLQEC